MGFGISNGLQLGKIIFGPTFVPIFFISSSCPKSKDNKVLILHTLSLVERACSIRVSSSMLTTLLFALEVKFVLKIENNA